MADKRLIIVKEAQEMKTLKDLADYVKKPVPHSIVVFAHKYKTFDKRTAVAKAMNEHVMFESKKLYDNQLPAWIMNCAKTKEIILSDQIAHVLADYLGNDLNKVENEIEKLRLSNGKGAKITMEHIQDQIGISKEFNVFELQKALGERNKAKSFLIAKYFAENPKDNPIQATVINLFSYFVKVMITVQHSKEGDAILQKKLGLTSAFFLKDYRVAAKNFSFDKTREIIQLIRQTDLASKGVQNKSTDDGQLLKQLIYGILA
jgi:DNA polymerase III subunit delta